eukprot:1143942-Pelagomonas_calceolata.AAC.4
MAFLCESCIFCGPECRRCCRGKLTPGGRGKMEGKEIGLLKKNREKRWGYARRTGKRAWASKKEDRKKG